MIHIIPANTKTDFEDIANLAHIIWYEHYPSIISLDQIAYMLKKYNSVEAIEARHKEGVLFFYVTYKEETVGYAAISKEQDYVYISKLYVLKEYRGKKIAKAIIDFVENLTKSYNFNKIRLHVNKYNTDSITAYKKMGFVTINDTITDIGSSYVMDDYEMERSIP